MGDKDCKCVEFEIGGGKMSKKAKRSKLMEGRHRQFRIRMDLWMAELFDIKSNKWLLVLKIPPATIETINEQAEELEDRGVRTKICRIKNRICLLRKLSAEDYKEYTELNPAITSNSKEMNWYMYIQKHTITA